MSEASAEIPCVFWETRGCTSPAHWYGYLRQEVPFDAGVAFCTYHKIHAELSGDPGWEWRPIRNVVRSRR